MDKQLNELQAHIDRLRALDISNMSYNKLQSLKTLLELQIAGMNYVQRFTR